MKKFELCFLNYKTKDIIYINVESIITDAYIHKQGYLELINTFHPNIDWLTYLAEKKLNKKLNNYDLDSYTEIK
jgi:hypothetical protein